ncbi:MAG: TonB-dependent receptor, partial [Cytophagales bacterium]
DIKNPIEFSIDPDHPQQRVFFYVNETRAYNSGVEFEFRKSFDFLNGLSKEFNNISFFNNLTLVRSVIDSEDGRKTKSRNLQGQSPFVLNLGLVYENEQSGWGSSLVLNRIGRRIFTVGAPGGQPYQKDLMENPRTVLDAQISKNVGKLNIRFTLGDILQQDLVFYQDLNENGRYDKNGDNTIFKYNNGYTGTLSFTYKF